MAGGIKGATFSSTGAAVGTTFSFALNERASITLTFTELVPGRKVNGRCTAQNSSNRHKPSGVRDVGAGKLSFRGHSGANKVHFEGRLSASRRLAVGNYQLTIVATNSLGARSKPRSLRFMIVK